MPPGRSDQLELAGLAGPLREQAVAMALQTAASAADRAAPAPGREGLVAEAHQSFT